MTHAKRKQNAPADLDGRTAFFSRGRRACAPPLSGSDTAGASITVRMQGWRCNRGAPKCTCTSAVTLTLKQVKAMDGFPEVVSG
jgi:hypothetical protein